MVYLMIHGVYKHSCINCGGETSDTRLHLRLPCEKCLPVHHEDVMLNFKGKTLTLYDLYSLVANTTGRVKYLSELYNLGKRVENVVKLFMKILGSEPWSAQKTWVRRVLKGKSFTIVAPTGTGKTVFGIIMSLYLSSEKADNKAYIILPTTPLVLQVYNKALSFAEKAGLTNIRILAYHAKLKKKEKDEVLSSIVKGKFNILITTSRFLTTHYDKVKDVKFSFIFVDDVDAILKSSKNIDRILTLLGFTEEDINIAYNLIKLKRQIARVKPEDPKFKELMERINILERKLAKRTRRIKSVLVVSTATGRPRGLRVKLFRELLGFEIGSRPELLRNIVDSYYSLEPGETIEETTYKLLKTLGKGGLVFVPVDKGLEYAEKLVEYLTEKGLAVRVFSSKELKALEEFIEGKVDALVGVATYYGVMVRGLDLPDKVRYAVFTGVPRFKFSTKFEEPHPYNIIRVLTILRDVLDEPEKRQVELMIGRLNRLLQMMPQAVISEIAEKLRSGEPIEEPVALFKKALDFIKEKLVQKEIKERLSKLEDIIVREEEGKTYIYIPDIMTYLQASGRTSRMFAGGITKGLSVVIVDEEKLLRGLIKRSMWIVEEAEWKNFKELDLQSLLEEIDKDREMVRMVLEGKITAKIKDLVKTVLLVVESPNKARTIANFFGKPSVRRYGDLKVYEVSTGNMLLMITASGGHVYDLVTNIGFHGVLTPYDNNTSWFIPIYTAIRRCLDCGYQFSDDFDACPKCGSKNLRNSLDIVNLIRELSTEVDLILIGTDPDTEGEKIGWDIASLLAPYTTNIRRIEFHEITKRAILNAINNPRDFNRNLVEAQIVRRVEDRWIGFELSSRLWRVFGKHWLSAGRVQTPVLGWIIQRHREWQKSKKKVYLVAITDDLTVEFLEDEVPSKQVFEKIIVEEEAVTEEEVNPLPPFTTDTLLTEASMRFKFSVMETMQYAQDLFELGFITYHRTDSIRVSTAGQVVAREYLKEVYGEKADKLYKPRTWGVGGAHECIRPTRPIDAGRLRELISEGVFTPVKPLTKNHLKLYDLIFRRFIASQMKPARVKKQTLLVKVGETTKRIERVMEVIDKGFLDIYPIVQASKRVKPREYKPIRVDERTKYLIPLYTQGDIIKLMKEKKIGRPSTYAKIVQTLLQRGYIRETKTKKLYPTDLGIKVYEHLNRNYKSLVSEERTAMLEEVMDLIERGERNYQEVLDELYNEIISIP